MTRLAGMMDITVEKRTIRLSEAPWTPIPIRTIDVDGNRSGTVKRRSNIHSLVVNWLLLFMWSLNTVLRMMPSTPWMK